MEQFLDSLQRRVARVDHILVSMWCRKVASRSVLLECAETLRRIADDIDNRLNSDDKTD